SERGNLRHIEAVRESWRLLPRHDYSAPPHSGRLFRERFHWVPFDHPRVDSEPSATIYGGIGDWASAGAAQRQPALDDPPGDEPRQADPEFAGPLDEAERERALRG